jgi:hypothetical protein
MKTIITTTNNNNNNKNKNKKYYHDHKPIKQISDNESACSEEAGARPVGVEVGAEGCDFVQQGGRGRGGEEHIELCRRAVVGIDGIPHEILNGLSGNGI